MMILHHLLTMLQAREVDGQLKARFVIFPMCNPIGMGQVGLHHHQGRYNLRSGINFNRGWFDLFAMLEANDRLPQLASALSPCYAAFNKAVIRQAVSTALDAYQPMTAVDHQRVHIAREASTVTSCWICIVTMPL